MNGIEEIEEIEEITVSASETNLSNFTLNNFSLVIEGMYKFIMYHFVIK